MPATALGARYEVIRQRTRALLAPLSAEDCGVQSMPDASPAKWHLGHTAWFFETLILAPREAGFAAFDARFGRLFNSYYQSLGPRHPRPERGLLTRPGLQVVLAYHRAVDERVLALLRRAEHVDAELRMQVEIGLQHEQQHQELLLTDIKHAFAANPLLPAYTDSVADPGAGRPAPAPGWHEYAGGLTTLGHAGAGFCFDNELPAHPVHLQPFRLATRLTTNGEFAEFVADDGYTEPRHWLADGWDWRAAHGRTQPLYWQRDGNGWQEFTLAGLQPLDPARPVVHLCCYEADAYARWAKARLPSEAEWEHAAATQPVRGNFADAGPLHPCRATEAGLTQLFGDVWEWTASSYAPYPGYRPAAGALGEYNGKFMINQYVLRGGSCVTPAGHLRASYRNFFPAAACWQFSGVRLATGLAS